MSKYADLDVCVQTCVIMCVCVCVCVCADVALAWRTCVIIFASVSHFPKSFSASPLKKKKRRNNRKRPSKKINK